MSDGQLSGRRLLLARPVRADDPLPGLVQRAGAELLELPVLRIESAENQQAIKDCILDFDNIDIALFVSARAARNTLDWLDQYWPMLPQGVTYLAVGESTAAVLSAFGCEVQWPAVQQNSEGLLALPALQQVRDKRITIFRGQGGRELLAETLRERGARVSYCELYCRVEDTFNISLLREQVADADGLFAHSGEILQAIGPVNDWQVEHLAVVVPSLRVLSIARELGYKHIRCAENASAEAMCAAFIAHFTDCNGKPGKANL